MKPSRLFFNTAFMALLCFVIFSGNTAMASSKPKSPQDIPAVTTKTIKSVDPKESTVVILYGFDKTLHTYKIDDITVLKVNNVTAKFADIKPGMTVDDYMERDNDDLDSLSLSGSGAEPAKKAPAKPKPAQ